MVDCRRDLLGHHFARVAAPSTGVWMMTSPGPIKMLNVTGLPAGPMEDVLAIIQEYTGRVDLPVDLYQQRQTVAGQDDDGTLNREDYEEWRLVSEWIDDRP